MADAEALLAGLRDLPDVQLSGLVLNERGFERAAATERAARDDLCDRGDRDLQPAQPGLDDRRERRELAQYRAAGARGGAAALRHDRGGVRLPFRRRSAGRAGGRSGASDRRCRRGRDLAGRHDRRGGAARCRGAVCRGRRGSARHSRCAPISTTRATPAMPMPTPPSAAACEALDSSLGGIGGCPFAPGSVGNIATEDLVYMLDRSEVETGARWQAARGFAVAAGAARAAPSSLVKEVSVFPKVDAQHSGSGSIIAPRSSMWAKSSLSPAARHERLCAGMASPAARHWRALRILSNDRVRI